MRFIFILAVVALLQAPTAQAQQAASIDGIIAIVGDEIITKKDVDRAILPAIELLTTQYASQPEEFNRKLLELRRERIEELIARRLILMDFTNSGYNLPESFIEDQVRDRIRQEYYGDRVKLTKTLQEEGVTMDQYRRNIRENLIVRYLREKHVSQELIISPYKIEVYYRTNQNQFKMEDQAKLRLIELTKSKEAPEAAGAIAAEIIRKLDSGASFEELAAVYSESARRNQGGDYGWVERTRSGLRKEITEAAFNLKAGEHSKVIDTPTACYVVKVEELKPSHIRKLSEVRPEIEKTLTAMEQKRLQEQWINRLKSKAFVRYF
jgi:peptidyl-prolyl cis-trans isomerase SurA